MKRFLLGFALALFVACGDDESSFAPRDEDSSSSVTPQSSESETSVSSSSKNGDAGTESGMTSSSAKSSSSMEQGDGGSEAAMTSSSKQSSSSKKVESSSSSLRLSSANLSSSSKKDGGSESAMTESSSSEKNSVLSSSRDYTPYAHDTCLAGNWNYKTSDYKTFVDPRNGRSYYYITVYSEYKGYSVTVMAENLNIGDMVLGENDQNDDSKIERYCYNNDTTYCDHYGGLYQWAEMMQLPSRCNTESCSDLIQPNHQGICPEGWRLFTYDDYTVVAGFNYDRLGETIAEGLRSQCFSGYNTSGFSLIGGGLRTAEGGFANLHDYATWFHPEENEKDPANRARHAIIAKLLNDSPGLNSRELKIKGFSVRCTKLE